MSIYPENEVLFQPTYLYIKQHTVTGKLYFGKTTKNHPEKYHGSGKHWSRHIKKHGKEYIVNLWYELFTNKEEIQEFALSFSRDMNIVESIQWLNLKPENGLDGGSILGKINKKHTTESKNRRSLATIGENNGFYNKHHSIESKIKISNSTKGKPKSDEHKKKIGAGQLGNKRGPTSEKNKEKLRGPRGPMGPQKRVKCPNCDTICGISASTRYHFDNCKSLRI